MRLFVVRRFLEDVSDLHIPVLFRLGGIEGVLVARLALAGERGHQIGFGAASLEFHNSSCLSFRLCAGMISAIVCPENRPHTPAPEKIGPLFVKKVLR